MSEIIIEGRCWVLVDKDGFLIDDIDTDQIYHNAYLHLTDRKLMGQYALGNLGCGKKFWGRLISPTGGRLFLSLGNCSYCGSFFWSYLFPKCG